VPPRSRVSVNSRLRTTASLALGDQAGGEDGVCRSIAARGTASAARFPRSRVSNSRPRTTAALAVRGQAGGYAGVGRSIAASSADAATAAAAKLSCAREVGVVSGIASCADTAAASASGSPAQTRVSNSTPRTLALGGQAGGEDGVGRSIAASSAGAATTASAARFPRSRLSEIAGPAQPLPSRSAARPAPRVAHAAV
jgi:hypothetical protein